MDAWAKELESMLADSAPSTADGNGADEYEKYLRTQLGGGDGSSLPAVAAAEPEREAAEAAPASAERAQLAEITPTVARMFTDAPAPAQRDHKSVTAELAELQEMLAHMPGSPGHAKPTNIPEPDPYAEMQAMLDAKIPSSAPPAPEPQPEPLPEPQSAPHCRTRRR